METEWKVGDKGIYLSKRGKELRYGKIDGIYHFENGWGGTDWYWIKGEKYLIDRNYIKACDFPDEKLAREEKEFRWKKYRYLFLVLSKEGLSLRFIKTKGTSLLDQCVNGIFEMVLELFDRHRSKVYVLERYWDRDRKKESSRLMDSEFYPGSTKFGVDLRDFIKIGAGDSERIDLKEEVDFNGLNKKIGKDLKYLIGSLYIEKEEGLRRWRLPDDDLEWLKVFVKRHELETYVQAKRDLMSDGDEIWGEES